MTRDRFPRPLGEDFARPEDRVPLPPPHQWGGFELFEIAAVLAAVGAILYFIPRIAAWLSGWLT